MADVKYKTWITTHMVVSIRGLEDRLTGKVSKKYGSWEILEKGGVMLTQAEVWAEIVRCKNLGYEVIPTCKKIDKRGHCKGHPKRVKEEEQA